MTKVIRECNRCGAYGEQSDAFTYLGDGVWGCPNCSCKYTHIRDIVPPPKSEGEARHE